MSVIGPGNIGALSIASSFAGAQRTESSTDRDKAEAAAKKFHVDQNSLSSQADDVAEADLSADRDPDGRLPYDGSPRQQSSNDAHDTQSHSPGLAPDAYGEKGKALDLQA